MDVNSGAVHVVDEMVYDMIQLLDAEFLARSFDGKVAEKLEKVYPAAVFAPLEARFGRDELEEAYGEIYEMYDNGQLFTADDYEQFADMMVSAPIKAMCLNVAHDCNLRCSYCFASTGDFGGERKLMTPEVGKKAIDYLLKYSGDRHNLEMDFFGGEPLMAFDVVKEVVEYARSKEKEYNKNFRFTITTNGMLLTDDKIDYINKEMYNVVLSLDGRKEVNDRMRFCVNGSGSYDIILPKFQKLVQKRGDGQYYVRGTFTKYNKDFTNDVLHFFDQGFEQISIEPVVTDPKLPYALTEEDLPEVFAEYEKLAKVIIEKRKNGEFFNFFHFMIDLDQGPCAIKRLSGCGAGHEYLAVAADGDLYPCHQFVGNKDFLMGNVYEGKLDEKIRKYFEDSNIYTKDKCRNCFAKFYCSGGCSANAFNFNGDINKPYELACEMEKKRVECAIAVEAAKKLG